MRLPEHRGGLGWRVIRYDVRGMGYSHRSVDDVELAARVLDVEAVVAALGLDRFALAGLDIGAATAVAYAVANQANVSRLILLSPWSSGVKYLAIPALRAAYAAEGVADRDPQLFANLLGSVATSFKDVERVRLLTAGHLKSTSREGLVAYNLANGRIGITELLPRVTVPTLVIHEPAFPFGSFELCQEVAAAIPGAEFLIVNDHSIAGRTHDETVTGMDRFLRGVPATGTSLHAKTETSSDGLSAPNGLTAREVQILQKVAAGATNKEIASEFMGGLSPTSRFTGRYRSGQQLRRVEAPGRPDRRWPEGGGRRGDEVEGQVQVDRRGATRTRSSGERHATDDGRSARAGGRRARQRAGYQRARKR